MLGQQLPPALKGLVSGLQFRVADHLVDARGEVLRERRVSDDVLDRALRVRRDQADAQVGRGVKGVRNADFSGLQTVLVHNVLLGRQYEPDCLVVERCVFVLVIIVISNQRLLRRGFLLLIALRFNVSQKRRRSFRDLKEKKSSQS